MLTYSISNSEGSCNFKTCQFLTIYCIECTHTIWYFMMKKKTVWIESSLKRSPSFQTVRKGISDTYFPFFLPEDMNTTTQCMLQLSNWTHFFFVEKRRNHYFEKEKKNFAEAFKLFSYKSIIQNSKLKLP